MKSTTFGTAEFKKGTKFFYRGKTFTYKETRYVSSDCPLDPFGCNYVFTEEGVSFKMPNVYNEEIEII